VSIDIIVVGENGWVDQQDRLEPHLRANAYGFFRRWWTGVTYFHRDGYQYRIAAVRPPRPLGVVDRILATTLYNPQLDFAIEYAVVGTYEVAQLRHAVATAIQRDDDTLTQFHEAPVLLARVNQAQSFDDVLAVLEFARTEDGNDGQDLDRDA